MNMKTGREGPQCCPCMTKRWHSVACRHGQYRMLPCFCAQIVSVVLCQCQELTLSLTTHRSQSKSPKPAGKTRVGCKGWGKVGRRQDTLLESVTAVKGLHPSFHVQETDSEQSEGTRSRPHSVWVAGRQSGADSVWTSMSSRTSRELGTLQGRRRRSQRAVLWPGDPGKELKSSRFWCQHKTYLSE